MTKAALPNGPGHMAFTVRYAGRSLRLTSEVRIFPAYSPSVPAGPAQTPGKNYTALYDTGATHSVISPQVVADLQLPSMGAANVGVGGGHLVTTNHLSIGFVDWLAIPRAYHTLASKG